MYVSIRSENKPGLYITANEDLSVTLEQESVISEELELRQTFHTVMGLDDESGISFESAAYPGYYLAIVDDVLTLTGGSGNATFYVTDVEY
ncbi:MAG: AbfB domain-containing protein [Lachnospiraceae bacterium]|nr:AbfB domain-containing protein [Lachnospiraceae bacterium]